MILHGHGGSSVEMELWDTAEGTVNAYKFSGKCLALCIPSSVGTAKIYGKDAHCGIVYDSEKLRERLNKSEIPVQWNSIGHSSYEKYAYWSKEMLII